MAYKRTFNGRRIMRTRRPVRRARRTMKRRPITKIVKQVIAKSAETKYLDHYNSGDLNGILTFPSQNIRSNEYHKITAYPVNGTESYNRIGDKIQNCFLIHKLKLEQYLQAAGVNPKIVLKIRVVVFSTQLGHALGTDLTQFFTFSRNTGVPITQNPINRDEYRVYYDRVFDIGYKSGSIPNSAATFQSFGNKDIRIKMNLGKTVFFSGPVDSNPKYMVQTRYLALFPYFSDGSNPTINNIVGRYKSSTRTYFKDY